MPRRRSTDKNNRGHSQRQLRVGEEIRHLLADLLERGNMRDPELRDARTWRVPPWSRGPPTTSA